MVTSDDFSDWKSNPFTKWVMESIRLEREELKEELATISISDTGARALKHAEYVGMCSALSGVLDLKYHERVELYKLDSGEEDESIGDIAA